MKVRKNRGVPDFVKTDCDKNHSWENKRTEKGNAALKNIKESLLDSQSARVMDRNKLKSLCSELCLAYFILNRKLLDNTKQKHTTRDSSTAEATIRCRIQAGADAPFADYSVLCRLHFRGSCLCQCTLPCCCLFSRKMVPFSPKYIFFCWSFYNLLVKFKSVFCHNITVT